MARLADEVEDIYELSPMQEGMLYHTLQAPGTGVYVEQLVCTLRGTLDAGLLERAWQLTIERHPVLRTAFIWDGLDKPLQAVRRGVRLDFRQDDWRARTDIGRQGALDDLLRRDRMEGFALDRAPLMRVRLVRLAGDSSLLVWSHHHLLLDGWSVAIVLQEAAAAYEALVRGELPSAESRRPYRDYIAWQRSRDLREAERLWRRELEGVTAATPLPTLLPTPLLSGNASEQADTITTELRLSEPESAAIDAFAREHGLTLSTVLGGAWAMLLSIYSGTDDVVFGASVSGRPADLDGSDRMVGLFINSLPVRVRIDAEQPAAFWLQELQARQAALREHDATPLVAIQQWAGLPQGQSLFDSLLVVVNYPVEDAVAANGSVGIEGMRGFERTSMPLTIFAVPGRELGLKAMSDSARYDRETLAALLARLRVLLGHLVTDGSRAVGAVPLLATAERERILVEWDAPRTNFPATSAHRLFEEQVAARPDATAVVLGDQTLSYAELNTRANRLARHLQSLGVGPEQPIALSVDRTLDMIVGALAIMKTGGAYVPIDPGFPAARVALMLDASQARVIVTESRHAGALSPEGRTVISLEHIGDHIATQSSDNLDVAIDPATIAYIVFTSGSTGAPKGAAISNGALANLLLFMRRTPGLAPTDRMLAIATMSFDLAVLELTLPLASGAAIVLADRATAADGRRLQALLRSARVTVMQGTPSTWRLLLASDWDGTPRMKMLSGGEPLVGRVADELLQRGTALWNLYGPTETTIYSTYRLVDPATQRTARDAVEPIGRPMPNQPHYVLDRHMRPVHPGVVGEIYVGGAGVGRGYASRPDLTAERFVPDPFSSEPGARLYRSGDLAKYRGDGVLATAGRSDFQVKIRGYRVELGEIEATLAKLPGVREAIVVSRRADAADKADNDAGDVRLVAYLHRETGADVSAVAARAAVADRLPDYMVPSHIVVLDELPRLPNGKPDRARLPEPGSARPDVQVAFEPPAGETERAIARLWQQVLKIDRIGANDNFFEVGGHSLLAVRLLGKLREELGRDLGLVDLFAYPTVRAMANHLAASVHDDTAGDDTTDVASGFSRTSPGVPGPEAEPVSSGRERLGAQRARRAHQDED